MTLNKSKQNGVLLLELTKSTASEAFCVSLKEKLRQELRIRCVKQITVEEFSNESSNIPLLVVCNNSTRLLEDVVQINNLLVKPDRTVILIVLHCGKEDHLPIVPCDLHTYYPNLHQHNIVEMGFDNQEGIRKIYKCELNTKAMKQIRSILRPSCCKRCLLYCFACFSCKSKDSAKVV